MTTSISEQSRQNMDHVHRLLRQQQPAFSAVLDVAAKLVDSDPRRLPVWPAPVILATYPDTEEVRMAQEENSPGAGDLLGGSDQSGHDTEFGSPEPASEQDELGPPDRSGYDTEFGGPEPEGEKDELGGPDPGGREDELRPPRGM